MARVRALAIHPRVVAIGETGLDFFRDRAPRDAQEAWFRGHIELALELKKPIIIHSRDAGKECLQILQEMGASKVGGVFHCFSEDAAFAEKLRDINFLISIPGNVTFKKAEAMRQAVAGTPISQIMVETDAPYLSPEPNRGKRCESAFMVETARCIAKVKGIELEEVAAVTTQNALRLFKL
jgi:TatD DNase family protein